ncbi:MFS transporter [Treponema sp. HNW]|uniref:MFS transporter n=1 Tax=Treponema sp. HNW TaxID=3116654 RepID=UPI003D0B8DB6
MNMIMPSFFLFAVYACVNVWLPLFLRNMNYSVTQVGLLLSIFEVFGMIIPFFTGNIPAKNGKYGLFLCVSGLILALIPLPLFSIPLFGITALCLGLYAACIKGAIPVSDSFIHALLGTRSEVYGRIRAVGSLGFVCANLVMQAFIRIDSINTLETILWMSVPAFIFALSLVFIPGLMTPLIQEVTRFSSETSKDACGPFGKDKSVFARFSPQYWLVLALIFLTVFGQIPFGRFFSMYVKEYLHSDAAGILWVISAMSEIPLMFFSSRFIRYRGPIPLLILSAAVTSVRNLIYVLFPSVAGAACAQLCNSITFGLFHPAAVMFAAREVRRAEDTVLSQLLYSVGTIGIASVLASALGGFVIDRFGYPFLFISYSAFPLAGILLFVIFNKRTKPAA